MRKREAETTQPDFECVGCGHEVYGREPVHCIKCKGTNFTRLAKVEVASVGQLVNAAATIIQLGKQIRLGAIHQQHPQAKQIGRKMYGCEAMARDALKLAAKARTPEDRGNKE